MSTKKRAEVTPARIRSNSVAKAALNSKGYAYQEAAVEAAAALAEEAANASEEVSES